MRAEPARQTRTGDTTSRGPCANHDSDVSHSVFEEMTHTSSAGFRCETSRRVRLMARLDIRESVDPALQIAGVGSKPRGRPKPRHDR